MVKAKGRNATPTLSPDGSIVALHEEGGGISLYRAGTNQPTVVKGTLPSEFPIRFVDGGRSLLVCDDSSKEVVLTVLDLASGLRKPWKRLSFSVQRKGKIIAVTPDLSITHIILRGIRPTSTLWRICADLPW